MSHDYTDEIKCPYCNYEFSDSHECVDSCDVTCTDCDKDFEVEVHCEIHYDSLRKDCPEGEHEYNVGKNIDHYITCENCEHEELGLDIINK